MHLPSPRHSLSTQYSEFLCCPIQQQSSHSFHLIWTAISPIMLPQNTILNEHDCRLYRTKYYSRITFKLHTFFPDRLISYISPTSSSIQATSTTPKLDGTLGPLIRVTISGGGPMAATVVWRDFGACACVVAVVGAAVG